MIRVLGRRLRGWRAGAQYRVAEDIRFARAPRELALRSDAFADGEAMPQAKTSPPLVWSGVPPATQCLVLVVEDVDAPMLRPFVHALVYELDPATTVLAAGALGGDDDVTMGLNGFGRRAYAPPTPLPGHGPHRYVFTLLAVGYTPHFDQAPTRGRLLDAIAGHVLALGELTGIVER
ncbi:MAG: YbhB/YbcL family Raf kinase inhibitor-like protein [Candidatus Eremiobacteraeota bacterium]|nr:YbhB/YbcL family Raf kinase inhibitor-like protein [Candidatus Eremiobacteraeota bacterium]MBV9408991.1 YbhB/YbcL family Raf kinase inhibitor-like protein [Candidatus Eremiobacteraeota bacterium]